MDMWKREGDSQIYFYPAKEKKTDATIVILPGGGYCCLAEHEGKGYAEFFADHGMSTFVCEYAVSPNRFPKELLDARRAIRWVRANAEKYGINPDKIAVMGSSAGGHLTAMVSTYTQPIEGEHEDEIDLQPYLPNAQILCYPVIMTPESGVAHEGSYFNLLGENPKVTPADVCPAFNVSEKTPQAFIWHTANDEGVNVINSYLYAKALREHNVPTEMHIFPYGPHGMGIAKNDAHVGQWTGLILNWFRLIGWLG